MKITVAQGLTCIVLIVSHYVYSQPVVSAADGDWNVPGTWIGGVVPLVGESVVVAHRVRIPAGASPAISQLTINGHLTLEKHGGLSLTTSAPGSMIVSGTLECSDSTSLEGTSVTSTVFLAGSRYVHRLGPQGFIPYAQWDASSTFQISGFTSSGYINIAHSDSWKQTFGHVIYDCPDQTVFIVDLNGYLRDIRGDFSVVNTNNRTLRLATTQQTDIDIGGNLSIGGQSQVWFSTNSPNASVSVSGDLICISEGTASSYLSTRGNISLTVRGSVLIDSRAPVRMASSAADSSGTRQSNIAIEGDLIIRRGGLIAPPYGSGPGHVSLLGTGLQTVAIPREVTMQGNLAYEIGPDARVDLGTSVLTSDYGALNVFGTVALGSLDAGGALQLAGGGNLSIPGPRSFSAGATLIYNGMGVQAIGDGHPLTANVVFDNPSEIVLLGDVNIDGSLTLKRGEVDRQGHSLRVGGALQVTAGARIDDITLTGSRMQTVDANNTGIDNLIINKGQGDVELISDLQILRKLEIQSGGTALRTNGFLTLRSTGSGEAETAFVAPLRAGSAVSGDVRVERFMRPHVAIYRYIASPVTNATVASLMDDFPVTGTFQNPSTGGDLNSTSPSLFEYDESVGGLQQGWQRFPKAGLAGSNPLAVGRGYAALVRNEGPVILDFDGPLNQGDVNVSLNFTRDSRPGNGWNLVANPYPAPVDWDNNAISRRGISQVICVRDNEEGRFRYWDGDVNYSDIPNGHIASGQSFWVRALDTDAVITFREEAKVDRATFYRSENSAPPSLMASIEGPDVYDKVYLKLRKQASASLDEWDGVKQMNERANLSMLSPEGVHLAIDARRELPEDTERISLCVTGLDPGSYVFRLHTYGAFQEREWLLEDDYQRSSRKIADGDSVQFRIDNEPASLGCSRFAIRPLPREPPRLPKSDTLTVLRRDTVLHKYINNRDIGAWLTSKKGKFLSDTVGVAVTKQGKIIDVYPNPATDHLTVVTYCTTCTHAPVFGLHNSAGVDVASEAHVVDESKAMPAVWLQRLDISALSSGIYLIRQRGSYVGRRFYKK